MDFKKGDEMILQGVRTDGWWYCLNKERNTYGWVHESSLQKCWNSAGYNNFLHMVKDIKLS
jgi:hypothetical protein